MGAAGSVPQFDDPFRKWPEPTSYEVPDTSPALGRPSLASPAPPMHPTVRQAFIEAGKVPQQASAPGNPAPGYPAPPASAVFWNASIIP